jgi:hypothetical protein
MFPCIRGSQYLFETPGCLSAAVEYSGLLSSSDNGRIVQQWS